MINKDLITKEHGSSIFVNTKNLQRNYLYLQDLVKPSKVGAVVKSNAYGIGIEAVAEVLYKVDCREFFVSTIEEGLSVKKVAFDSNIYILHGIFENSEDIISKNNLIPVLNSISQINKWVNFAKKKQQKLRCLLHIDTGMNRLGLNKEDLAYIKNDLLNIHNYLDIKYVISHLACSSLPDSEFNFFQLKEFNNITNHYFKHSKLSLVSSYGIFFGKEFHFDLVRPGFALYGSNPVPNKTNPLFPVIEFYSTILKINKVKKGNKIGYNHIWTASEDSIIAAISLGYNDGMLVNHSKDAGFFINDEKVPIVGRISMDIITIDITHVKKPVKEGNIVEIIGKNQDIDKFSALNNVINCNALTMLGLRYPRIYY